MSRTVLKCEHLRVVFGGLAPVSDFSIEVKENEIAGLIGPNGAGKTTVFNLLTGVYVPTKGKVLLDGRDLEGLTTIQRSHAGIARTFQNIRLFKNVSVLDNVLNTLRQRFPSSSEVTVDDFEQLGGADVANVLVGEVGDSKDGAFLDGPLHLGRVVDAHLSDLETTSLVFLDDFGFVNLHLLEFEGTANDVGKMPQVILEVNIFFCCLPHAENVILLNVPDVTLCECLER